MTLVQRLTHNRVPADTDAPLASVGLRAGVAIVAGNAIRAGGEPARTGLADRYQTGIGRGWTGIATGAAIGEIGRNINTADRATRCLAGWATTGIAAAISRSYARTILTGIAGRTATVGADPVVGTTGAVGTSQTGAAADAWLAFLATRRRQPRGWEEGAGHRPDQHT